MKSNSCYDYQLKVAKKGIKKRNFNVSCDGIFNWEMEFSVNENKENYTT